MKLYLVRYGQTDWNTENRRQGSVNIELNQTGIEQAEALKDKLANIDFKVCYTSPLSRAAETARTITENKVQVLQSDLLTGRAFGEFEGKLQEEIHPDADIYDIELNAEVNGIEPIQHVIGRAREFLSMLKNTYSADDNILVVTHGIIIRIIRSLISDDPSLADFNSYRLENAEVIELEI